MGSKDTFETSIFSPTGMVFITCRKVPQLCFDCIIFLHLLLVDNLIEVRLFSLKLHLFKSLYFYIKNTLKLWL